MKQVEKKQSAEDKALELFADMMIEKIESISEDWHKPWFTEGAMQWPRNLYGREYGSLNAFMLMLHCEKQGYKIPIFCTFDTVKYMNYTKVGDQWKRKTEKGSELPLIHVNKGEKSFPIFLTTYTVVNKTTKEKIKYETYEALSDEEQANYDVYPKRSVFFVFNIDQTNMKEARPEMYQKYVDEFIVEKEEQKEDKFSFAPLDEMRAEQSWYCPIYLKYQDNAYYSVTKNEIVLPEKRQFEHGEDFYGTLLHEMTHSTGCKTLNNRFGKERDYAKEELVAEMGAALVMSRYGMAKHLKSDSASYLKAWLKSLHETPDFIKTVLNDVKKATRLITEKIDEHRKQTIEEAA